LNPERRDSEPTVRLGALSKWYGEVPAVQDLSLDVHEGEFFSLLGPSGSGKTTTLRLIAGFETPSAGQLVIQGQDMTRVPPHRRDIGMVFQNYALFPHKTVAENVAFGLRMRRLDKREIERRVGEALDLVELRGLDRRRPNQLSGGQQQRVALARAVVIRPRLLLADEPLGALDRKLRQAMQLELRQLQENVGITMVYVTHDQEEALILSDRIGIMQGGRLVQIGAPRQIYEQPGTRFVADFIGTSNFLHGRVAGRDDGAVTIETRGGLRVRVVLPEWGEPNGSVTLAVRPEKIDLFGNLDGASNRFSATIQAQTYLGDATLSRVRLTSGDELLVRHGGSPVGQIPPVGELVLVGWRAEDAVILRE
jgi:putative spermidine/putrescine transport system ATP-binding protein